MPARTARRKRFPRPGTAFRSTRPQQRIPQPRPGETEASPPEFLLNRREHVGRGDTGDGSTAQCRSSSIDLVIPRACTFQLPNFQPAQVQSLFRSLLIHEFGAYWTFLFYDGEQYFVGASPERHISSRKGAALTRLPLWATAKEPSSHSARKGEA